MSRLSPIDILHAEFRRRAGGYDRREVRAFLERLSLDVEESLREAQGLRRRLAEAEEELGRLRGAEAELQHAVMAADRIALELKENAKREAQLVLEEAERMRRSRLADVEADLVRARAELDLVDRQRLLFEAQFRALLRAYEAALNAGDSQAGAAPRAYEAALGAGDSQADTASADPEDALLDDSVNS